MVKIKETTYNGTYIVVVAAAAALTNYLVWLSSH